MFSLVIKTSCIRESYLRNTCNNVMSQGTKSSKTLAKTEVIWPDYYC